MGTVREPHAVANFRDALFGRADDCDAMRRSMKRRYAGRSSESQLCKTRGMQLARTPRTGFSHLILRPMAVRRIILTAGEVRVPSRNRPFERLGPGMGIISPPTVREILHPWGEQRGHRRRSVDRTCEGRSQAASQPTSDHRSRSGGFEPGACVPWIRDPQR